MIFKAHINQKRLSRALDKFPKQTFKNIGLELSHSSRDIVVMSQKLMPTKHGDAVKSLQYRIDKVNLDSRIGINVAFYPIANYIHDGTRQFGPRKRIGKPIKPKNKKALRWVGPDGRFRFATIIKKPVGMKPNPFMVKAAEKTKNKRHKGFNQAVSKAAKGVFI